MVTVMVTITRDPDCDHDQIWKILVDVTMAMDDNYAR